jgi:NTP pyrophosphatase (non-canonical NTP hydrolase)
MDKTCTVQSLKDNVNQFVIDREWSEYHTPRNIVNGIVIESSELLAEFQWENKFNNPIDINRVKNELADVVIYSLCLANCMDIDLSDAIKHKMDINAEKYPSKVASFTIDFK